MFLNMSKIMINIEWNKPEMLGKQALNIDVSDNTYSYGRATYLMKLFGK